MLLVLTLFFSFLTYAQVCEPVITLKPQSTIVLKEGHRQEQAVGGVYVEMDRYCLGENVSVTVLLRSGSAVVGEHVSGAEINQVTIPSGQIVSYLNFAVIGDNDWNEDRIFSAQAINPSHGTIDVSTIDFTIKNDDPQISIVVANKVTEPRKGTQAIPLSVQLSMPAEQRITGEIEFREQTASREIDFEAPYTHSFEILPGETEFSFLPNTLIVYADEEKEKEETLRLFLNNVKNATPANESALILIKDPKSYEVTFTSEIKAIAEARVAMTSSYSVYGDLTFEAADGVLHSEDLVPTYVHSVVGLPGPVRISPGKIRISARFNEDELVRLRLEFLDSPFEIYPYMSQRLFMYMSSFGKLHEEEFISIQAPGSSPYPAFDLKKIIKTSEDQWKASYINRLTEDGAEALQERTEVFIKIKKEI